MDGLQSLDVALFRFVNVQLKNGFLDWLMPYFSSNVLFVPALCVLAVWLVTKGGVRGRLFGFFLLLTFLIGDPLIVNSLKGMINRPRPFTALNDIHLLVGGTDNASMPSGHAANWFAATTVAWVYYRRSLLFMLPMALIEAFSRVYLGVHYPSDVLVGSLLGMAYAAGILALAERSWAIVGRRWFPLWWSALPSFLNPPVKGANAAAESTIPSVPAAPAEISAGRGRADDHWIRLGYILIVVLLVGHWGYLASGKIELSEDEAYQWLWSKHLALSYFSKPPLIAFAQFTGTHLWGDTEFGIRFCAPLLGAITSLIFFRFLAREVNGMVACLSVIVATAIPLLMVGATLITIDSLSVLFWVAALVSGWNAVRQDSLRSWICMGLWIALGFLSKYIAYFQWLCWIVLFVLWPPARACWRKPGPYLALLISLLGLLPVLIWNAQNHWITLTHLANRGGLDTTWQPTLRYAWDFVLAEGALLNPIFFLGGLWALARFWRQLPGNGLMIYLFSMSAPLVLFYGCYTLRARVQPNWIAPAVVPLLGLMLVYWHARWREGLRWIPSALFAAMFLGWLVVVPLHDTRLIKKMSGIVLPPKYDPLTRVRGWKETVQIVQQARTELLAEGKPVFIIGDHYGITSLMSFYLPEAKAGVPNEPLAYYLASDQPKNQFYFWPGYQSRKGQNALYVAGVDKLKRPPPSLEKEFESVVDLGLRDVLYKGMVQHRVQLFACRGLR